MWGSWSHSSLVGHYLMYVKREFALIRDKLQKKKQIYSIKALWHLITEIGIKMIKNEKEIYDVQFSIVFSNLSCSHISDNLRPGTQLPPHQGVSFVTGFSLFVQRAVFSLPVLSACRMPFPPFLPFFSTVLKSPSSSIPPGCDHL